MSLDEASADLRPSERSSGPRPAPTPAGADPAVKPEGAATKPKRSRALFIFVFLIVAAGAIGGTLYVRSLGKESTDDAQVEGHIVNVAARVPGQVSRVLVQDNQAVHAGDVLVELDRADLDARLAVANADLESAQAGLASARAQLALAEQTVEASLRQARGGLTQASSGLDSTRDMILQSRADVQAAQSRAHLADIELRRVQNLFAEHAVSQAELDSRQAQSEQAQAAVLQAQARLASTSTGVSNSLGAIETARGRMVQAETGPQQIGVARAAVALAEARVLQAQASVHVAELNLSYTTVRAPADGVVSRRTVEVGQTASPERPMMALVPTNDVWVVANFREDQLRTMHAGQRARISIDTYGNRDFEARVDSLAGASGARFALLPPDNASGNFVKVVQRIPVLLRFEGNPGVQLRPGMSADVTVITR